MSPIATLAAKDLRVLWRDKFGLFWILIFPLVFALFFGTIMGGPDDGARAAMRIALVDLDRSPQAAAFAKQLAKSDGIELKALPESEARDEVRRGRLTGYIVLKEGFGKSSG